MSEWQRFPLSDYKSIEIQQHIEHPEWLRIVVDGVAMHPFSIELSELDGNKWLKNQLDMTKALYPDNADIVNMERELA